jgi:ketosteroid isomerase-like protein
MSDANVEVVQNAYERFGSGDISGVIDLLSENVKWDHSGPELMPFARLYEGRAEVREFFRVLGETMEPVVFEPREFFVTGDRVVVLGFQRWKVKSTGKEWESDWAHVYTVQDGLITAWRPMYDMTAQATAFQA